MSRTVCAGKFAATAFVAALAVWSLKVGLESLHLHESHETAFAHHHGYVGPHQHDELPESPGREDDDEGESRRGTVSSLESGAPLLRGTNVIAPTRKLVVGTLSADPLPVPKAEPRSSAVPRAPPR